MNKKIVPIIPIVGFGLLVLSVLLSNITGENTVIQSVVSIISIAGHILSLTGLPIGIIYKKKEDTNKTICILDIIFGILTIIFIILEIFLLFVLYKFITGSIPVMEGILHFLNTLTEIG